MYANTKKTPEVWRFIGDSPRQNRPAPGAQKIVTAKPLAGYRRVNTVSQLHDLANSLATWFQKQRD